MLGFECSPPFLFIIIKSFISWTKSKKDDFGIPSLCSDSVIEYYLELEPAKLLLLVETTSAKNKRVTHAVTTSIRRSFVAFKVDRSTSDMKSPFSSRIPVLKPDTEFRTIIRAFP